ncbi:MAG: sulfite exporter TauE/SafE family protein [Candidatus Woesearchaeota archaeon]
MMEPITVVLLAIIIFVINFFGVISGGKGLILRPIMIAFGIPAQITVGSARTSALGTSTISLIAFIRKGKVDWRLGFLLAIPMALGGLIGAYIVLGIPEEVLQKVIGITVIVIGIWLLVSKNTGVKPMAKRLGKKHHLLGNVLTTIASIFNTIVGGQGPIFSAILIGLYGKTYLSLIPILEIASLAAALVSGIVFVVHGLVDWWLVLLLIVAGGIGTWFGVHHGVKWGEKYARTIVLVVVFVLGIKMIFF